ncbi:MAG: pyridoxamine 5'-phosphate oxidase family protein [Patescibacteria group bacterium]
MDHVLRFLKNHRICSLSILTEKGPHAAAMHYSHRDTPLALFFSTDKNSRKTSGILKNGGAPASVVIGFSEGNMQTLQMDGTMRAVTDGDLQAAQAIHYAKITESARYKDDPDTLFLAFEPHWVRFSNHKEDNPVLFEQEL